MYYGQHYTFGYDGLISNSSSETNLPDYDLIFRKQNYRSGTYTLPRTRFYTESAVNGDTNYVVEFAYKKAHLFLVVVFNVVTAAEKQYTYGGSPALNWPGTGCPVFCSSQMSSYVAQAVAPASAYTGRINQKTTTRLGLGGNSAVQSPFYLTTRQPDYLLGYNSRAPIDFGAGMNEKNLVGSQSKELRATGFWINGDLPESEYDARAVSLNTYNDALVLCPPAGVFDWLKYQGGTNANRVTPYLLYWTPSQVVIETPPATAGYYRSAFVAPAGNSSPGASTFQVMGEPSFTLTPPTNSPNGSFDWRTSSLIATAGYYDLFAANTQQTATTTARIAVNYSQ
jgi:hypothetical protein